MPESSLPGSSASRSSSPYAWARAPHQPLDPPGDVQTTTELVQSLRDGRRPMLNQYVRWARVGGGQHGNVYLGYDMRDPAHPQRVAIKSVSRDNPRAEKWKQLRKPRIPTSPHLPTTDRLGTTELKIRKEIAIMKKCRHAHVVRLLEVIDDRLKSKIYMIMEYLGGGEVKWKNSDDEPILLVEQTRRILRDAILGLEYLHFQGIIHRDIKPANLLWTDDRSTIKIADFGVSHFSYAQRIAAAGNVDDPHDEILLDDSDLSKRAGTPSFMAPEIVFEHTAIPSPNSSNSQVNSACSSQPRPRPPITKAIDIWALGVTMYCLLFGKTPFNPDAGAGSNEFSMYNAICNKGWSPEPTMGHNRIPITDTEGQAVIHLLEQLLEKDPTKRIELQDVKRHHWFTHDIPNVEDWLRKTVPSAEPPFTATDVEVGAAMSNVRFRWHWSSKFTRQLSSLFRTVRSRPRRHERDEVGISSAPQVSIGRRKSASATMRASSVTRDSRRQADDLFIRSVPTASVRDKGKKRADSNPAKRQVLQNASNRSRSIERWPAAKKASGATLGLEGSAPKARRGSETLLPPATPRTSSSPSIQTSHERPRPRFSLNLSSIWHWRPNKFSSQGPSPVETSPRLSPTAPGPSASSSGRQLPHSRLPSIGGFTIASDGVIPAKPRRSIDSDSGMLTAARRASSWGDNAADFADVTSLNSDEHDVDETAMIVGAGGISNELPVNFMRHGSSRLSSPLAQVAYEPPDDLLQRLQMDDPAGIAMDDASSSLLDSSFGDGDEPAGEARGFDYDEEDEDEDEYEGALEIRTTRSPGAPRAMSPA